MVHYNWRKLIVEIFMSSEIINFIEIGFSLTLFINAILFIPQIISLYKNKDSKELSLLTFVGFNFTQIFAFLHGYVNDDDKLMYGMLLSFLLCFILNILILYYRYKK